MIEEQQSLFADSMPYSTRTESNLQKPIELDPRALAVMHGSSFAGDGASALRDLGVIMQDVPAQ